MQETDIQRILQFFDEMEYVPEGQFSMQSFPQLQDFKERLYRGNMIPIWNHLVKRVCPLKVKRQILQMILNGENQDYLHCKTLKVQNRCKDLQASMQKIRTKISFIRRDIDDFKREIQNHVHEKEYLLKNVDDLSKKKCILKNLCERQKIQLIQFKEQVQVLKNLHMLSKRAEQDYSEDGFSNTDQQLKVQIQGCLPKIDLSHHNIKGLDREEMKRLTMHLHNIRKTSSFGDQLRILASISQEETYHLRVHANELSELEDPHQKIHETMKSNSSNLLDMHDKFIKSFIETKSLEEQCQQKKVDCEIREEQYKAKCIDAGLTLEYRGRIAQIKSECEILKHEFYTKKKKKYKKEISKNQILKSQSLENKQMLTNLEHEHTHLQSSVRQLLLYDELQSLGKAILQQSDENLEIFKKHKQQLTPVLNSSIKSETMEPGLFLQRPVSVLQQTTNSKSLNDFHYLRKNLQKKFDFENMDIGMIGQKLHELQDESIHLQNQNIFSLKQSRGLESYQRNFNYKNLKPLMDQCYNLNKKENHILEKTKDEIHNLDQVLNSCATIEKLLEERDSKPTRYVVSGIKHEGLTFQEFDAQVQSYLQTIEN